jgi:CotH kinase protein/Putative metal-binding motif
MRRIWVAVVGVIPWLVLGCGDDLQGRAITSSSGAGGAAGAVSAGAAGGGGGGAGDTPTAGGGAGGAPTAGGGAGGGVMPTARGCSDLFDPAVLVDYAFDISADEWAKIDYEFRNRDALAAAGVDYKTFHPIVFHHGGETVSDAMVRLKGQSSWRQTVRDDGDKARMQFVVSFEEVNPAAKFHGLSKVVLDMPNNDQTFMQERLGFVTMAEIFGMAAPCANSARVTINGQYYGVYVNEEHIGGGYIKRVFPDAPDGDLFAGGRTPKTNELMPDKAKLAAFWAARDIASMAAVVDMDASIAEWAAEALLNDGDGYWGGGHNFYIYDYAGKGYRWLLDDADATFAWLGRSDVNLIYWWAGRTSQQEAGQHYLLVMSDPTWRANYLAAVRAQLARWDVARVQGWIDTWSAQIADAVAQDPHRLHSIEDHREALAEMRQEVVDRPAYVAKFLACEDGSGDASDGDGDGFAWCNDCDDANPAVNPGAVEICGNAIDDNCNRRADAQDGCPAM